MSDAWSITDGYWDTTGAWHATSERTRAALAEAMGRDGESRPPDPPPMWFVGPGEAHPLQRPCRLLLEDGTVLERVTSLPPDLPVGHHDLAPDDGGPVTRLVVTPRRMRLPERTWGWSTQLYALRSARSWGMGDLGDLRELARWTAATGGGVVMTNPLHAHAPVVQQQPSPYFPSSRLWRDVAYLRIEDLPGAAELDDVARLDESGRRLNASARVERDASLRLKLGALRALYARTGPAHADADGFDSWRARQGDALRLFALYCALAERYGPDFHRWPAGLRHPGSAQVEAFGRAEADAVRFHEWCQWLLDRQLASAATAGAALMSDLAVGFDPSGADAWAYQDLLAPGCRIGAPPDDFNAGGQDWGLPPFVPWKLRHALYSPLVATFRAALTHCAGLRIDHVMGFFRLFWIPPGCGAADGAYVRYDASEILDLLAVEAHRAGAFVVGEDLGTVEDEVREELARRGVLSYRLLWFEEEPPERFPRQALASITTHDLPTVAGVWSGADHRHRVALGLAREGEREHFATKLRRATGVDVGGESDPAEVIVAAHRALARAPSLVLLAALDDAAATEDRPNHPGTVDEWPNWRLPLPRTLDQLMRDRLPVEIARVMNDGIENRTDDA